MADENDDIIQRIILEGADEVVAKLRAVGVAGAEALGKLGPAAQAASTGLGRVGTEAASVSPALLGFGSGLGVARREAEVGRESIRGFREGIHALHPVLEEAGIRMGVLSGLVRASTGGVVLLGAAVAGVATVGLAKLGDSALVSEKRLGDLFKNAALGKKVFGELEQTANELGVPVENLAGPVGKLFTAFRDLSTISIKAVPGQEQFLPAFNAANNLQTAIKSLTELIRADTPDATEAFKALDEVIGSVTEKGKLTAEAVKKLYEEAPKAADALGRAFNQSDAIGLQKAIESGLDISLQQLVSTLVRIEPESKKAFDTEKLKTFSGAVEESGNKLSLAFKKLTGAEFTAAIAGTLTFLTNGLVTSINAIGASISAVQSLYSKVSPTYTPTQGPVTTPSSSGTSPESKVIQKREELLLEQFGIPQFASGGLVGDNVFSAIRGFAEGGPVGGGKSGGDDKKRSEARSRLTLDYLMSQGVSSAEKINTVIDAGGTSADFSTLLNGQEVKLKNADGSYSPFKLAEKKDEHRGSSSSGSGGLSGFSPGLDFLQGGWLSGFMASGGPVRGAGTGTSDSILARLSHGEFVVRADGSNLGDAIAHYSRRFAEGGLVEHLFTPDVPRFADGGPVLSSSGSSGLHPVSINFNGQHIGTLHGTPDAVAEMQQASVVQQVSSLGPKPSHYK